jgi:hypothetical protein
MIAENCTEHAQITKRDLEKFSLDIRECVNLSRSSSNHAMESYKYVKELREVIAGLFCTTMCLVVILFSFSWAFAHVKIV